MSRLLKKRRWILLLPVIGAFIWIVGIVSKDEVIANNVEETHLIDRGIGKREVPPFIRHPLDHYVEVAKGDTFVGILDSSGLSGSSIFSVVMAMREKGFDPKHLVEGQHLRFRKSQGDGILEGLRLDIDSLNSLVVVLGDAMEAEFFDSKPIHDYFIIRGEVQGSLYKSLKNMGLSDRAIVEFVDVFGFDIDFQRDIHPNDKFMLVYGESREDGSIKVFNAELESSAGEFVYYRYYQNGELGYYDKDGNSAKKALMRTPISGARLSSGFGYRKHPISGYRKMHQGIDFAAPTGTPIYAAGDGVIERVGSRGGYGKHVVIRHGNNYKTLYAHMSRFARSIKIGRRVKQRQVIGYVGSTGLSTGPHLHYEVISGGKKINPSKLRLPKGKSISRDNRAGFERYVSIFRNIDDNIVIGSPRHIGSDDGLDNNELIKKLTLLHG